MLVFLNIFLILIKYMLYVFNNPQLELFLLTITAILLIVPLYYIIEKTYDLMVYIDKYIRKDWDVI